MMDVGTLETLLEQRALTSLLNPLEVTPDLLERASREALELTEGKPIPEAMLLDVAIVRLKLWLKTVPEDFELKLSEAALKKAAATACTTQEDGTVEKKANIAYGNRASVWGDAEDSDFMKACL